MLPGLPVIVLAWGLIAQVFPSAQLERPVAVQATRTSADVKQPARFEGATWGARNITLTLGGFAEMVGIFRQHFMSDDIATSFWAVPFPTKGAYFAPELRLSSRQTRLFIHAVAAAQACRQGDLHIEIDFLGAAPTANSVQSNSYTPRLRHAYASVSWQLRHWNVSIVAGQTWSLITMAGPGLEPGTEALPPGLEAQYVPGFMWARQPQLRLVAGLPRAGLTFAVSLENPQTTFLSAAPPGAVTTVAGGFLFNPSTNMSLNYWPDAMAKMAFDGAWPSFRLHSEVVGVLRAFSVRSTQYHNESVLGGGVAGSIRATFPQLRALQLVASGAYGDGLGRYGSAQFVDASLNSQAIAPHPRLRLYAFVGMEKVDQHNDLPDADNTGCMTPNGTCTGANGMVSDITGGAWVTMMESEAFRMRLGLQYGLISRTLLRVAQVGPTTRQSQGYVGLRCEL